MSACKSRRDHQGADLFQVIIRVAGLGRPARLLLPSLFDPSSGSTCPRTLPCEPFVALQGLHINPVIGFVQDAVSKALIFVRALAAKFYDVLHNHLTGFDCAFGDLKRHANIVERVRHGSRRVGSEHVDRSHWRCPTGTMRGGATRYYDTGCFSPQNQGRSQNSSGQAVAVKPRAMGRCDAASGA